MFLATGAAAPVDGHPSPTDPCDPPYQVVANSCYRMSTSFVSWATVEAACEAEGAHLSTIVDVPGHFTLHTMSGNAVLTEVWIGYTDRVTEGMFRWVSVGGLDPFSDQCFFGPGGPVNNLGQNCVVQESQSACGDWFVRDCAITRPYICERDGDAAIPATY